MLLLTLIDPTKSWPANLITQFELLQEVRGIANKLAGVNGVINSHVTQPRLRRSLKRESAFRSQCLPGGRVKARRRAGGSVDAQTVQLSSGQSGTSFPLTP